MRIQIKHGYYIFCNSLCYNTIKCFGEIIEEVLRLLVAGKCPSCGAEIRIPKENEFVFCSYCGSRIQRQVAETLYKIEIGGNVRVDGIANLEEMLRQAETFEKLQRTVEAYKKYHEITKTYPWDWRGWWGVCRTSSDNHTFSFYPQYQYADADAFECACKLLDKEDERYRIEEEYTLYWHSLFLRWIQESTAFPIKVGPFLEKNQEYNRLYQIGRENAERLNADITQVGQLPVKVRKEDFIGILKETRYRSYCEKYEKEREKAFKPRRDYFLSLISEANFGKYESHFSSEYYQISVLFALGNTLIIYFDNNDDSRDSVAFTPKRSYTVSGYEV